MVTPLLDHTMEAAMLVVICLRSQATHMVFLMEDLQLAIMEDPTLLTTVGDLMLLIMEDPTLLITTGVLMLLIMEDVMKIPILPTMEAPTDFILQVLILLIEDLMPPTMKVPIKSIIVITIEPPVYMEDQEAKEYPYPSTFMEVLTAAAIKALLAIMVCLMSMGRKPCSI